MGYGKAHYDSGEVRYGTQQDDRNSAIGDVRCDGRKWKLNCEFKRKHKCDRKQVTFLKCGKGVGYDKLNV